MGGLSETAFIDFLKPLIASPRDLPNSGSLLGPKTTRGNYKNDDQLGHTKTSEHTPPPDAITLCFGVRDVNLMVKVEIWGWPSLIRISSAHLASCINSTRVCRRQKHLEASPAIGSRTRDVSLALLLPCRWSVGSLAEGPDKRSRQRACGRVCSRQRRCWKAP